MTNLVLVKTADFNGVALDCYIQPKQQDKGYFWATRTQIGQLLGYKNPRTSIANIHNRHLERLSRFSGVTKLSTPEGGTQEVTVYSFKGLLEICRYSTQPRANAVMDWLWEVADEIRRKGYYALRFVPREELQSIAFIYKHAGLKGNQLALALNNYFETYTGRNALKAGCVELEEEKQHRFAETILDEVKPLFSSEERK